MLGGFEVEYDGIAVAQFFYYTEWDERGFMTRDAAKKLAIELRDKIKKCTTEESDTGITFVEKEQPSSMTNKQEVFVRYTRDEAIILFNYRPVLRIPTRYKLGDQEVDMCEEVVDWANQIVEDLNEHVILPDINEKEKK